MKSTFMKQKSDEFESLKKVDSVLYRFIADFRPDVISGTPIQKPRTPDFKQIIHEILRTVFKLILPTDWFIVLSIKHQFENQYQ